MEHLPTIYGAAVLLPLASFFVILLLAKQLGRYAAWVATTAILVAGVFSFWALGIWLTNHFPQPVGHGGHHVPAEVSRQAFAEYLVASTQQAGHQPAAGHEAPAHAAGEAGHGVHHAAEYPVSTGEYYTLGQFGGPKGLRVTISYYIDALTVVMFCMVTFIASCIHFYAIGYMHDELTDITDKEVALSDGRALQRPGRYPRFFQYLSLFCFSMLGLVLSGNIAMVFVFWELVGICSYFLIGFYVERKSASTAANKAFIVNRVGDFGFIIGLMALWSTLGTFSFGDTARTDADGNAVTEPGIFSLVRPGPSHALIVPDGMVQADAKEEVGQRNGKPVMASAVAEIVRDHASSRAGLESAASEIASRTPQWRGQGFGYWLLVLAGLGIFCG